MSRPDDALLARIGNAITLPRPRVAEIYDLLAAEHQGARLMALPSPPTAPYLAGLQQACDGEWFAALVERLLHAGAFVAESTDAGLRVELQGVLQERLGFLDPQLLNASVATAIRRVCLVNVDRPGAPGSGTGFLVGPQTVLTAWHVIQPLLGADGEPAPGSARQLRLTFEHVSGLTSLQSVAVHERWLLGKSRPHPLETPPGGMLDFDTVAQPSDFDKHLDFALLLLAAPVGRQRGYYRLDRARKPCVTPPRTQVVLFQHPAGQPLLVATGSGRSLWPPTVETRMRHDANSVSGSSGGLILDADWQPVALHQCGYRNAAGQALVNGAIPTACIAANDVPFDTVQGLDPIWRLPGTQQLLIGRDAFQASVLDAASGVKRIIAVAGAEQSGKSFCIDILRALLGQAEHAVVKLVAADVSARPGEFAAKMLSAAGRPPGAPSLPQPADAETAQDAWIRDTLYPALVTELRAIAGTRRLWLVIDDLDANALANTGSRQLLDMMYREIVDTAFLRIVLIGLRGVVPAAPPAVVAYQPMQPFTQSDLETYIERRFAERNEARSSNDVAMWARSVLNAAAMLPLPSVPAVALAMQKVFEDSLPPP